MRFTSRWNWNLEMLVFTEGGKPENPEKNPRSKDENQQQTQPTYDTGTGNRTRATLVEGECSHHCAIPATHAEDKSASKETKKATRGSLAPGCADSSLDRGRESRGVGCRGGCGELRGQKRVGSRVSKKKTMNDGIKRDECCDTNQT